MKPYLTIKKVKDKKYIQIRDLHGNLIHIGPASKIETWSVAYQALKNAYEGLYLEELLAFKHIADKEGINLMAVIDARTQGSESWKAFRKKQDKKRLMRFVTNMIFGGIDINDPRLREKINEMKNELRVCEETARTLRVSPESLEMTDKIYELYEEKTEK